MRRLAALVAFATLLTTWVIAQDSTSYQHLASVARFWATVKYLHPRVHAPGVNWDQAFLSAAPRVLAARTDTDYAVAVDEMLAALHDPATHVLRPGEPLDPVDADPRDEADPRIVPTMTNKDGVAVVTLGPGTIAAASAASSALTPKLAGAAVVFDLRGSTSSRRSGARNRLPSSLPVSASAIPLLLERRHYGFGAGLNPGTGYYSSWDVQPSSTPGPYGPGPRKVVFLVDSATAIPPIVLAKQSDGSAAIVSEDALSDSQVAIGRTFDLDPGLHARVRTNELIFPDGTAGLTANVVLRKTGAEALTAAMDMARSGVWPKAPPRAKYSYPLVIAPDDAYADLGAYPDLNHRLLAAARIWGVFNFFHAYKYLYDDDWDAVLAESLPTLAQARNAREYHLGVARMVAHTRDSHNLVSSNELRDFAGANTAPSVDVHWIENQPVITRILDPVLKDTIQPGDIVTRINGRPVEQRIEELKPTISASTPQALMNTVTTRLFYLDGPDGTTTAVRVRTRDGSEKEFPIHRRQDGGGPFYMVARPAPSRPGDPVRFLTPKIGYADLELLKWDEVDGMFERFKNTDAIVFDMRGYPNGTTSAIAGHLQGEGTPRNGQDLTPIIAPSLYGKPWNRSGPRLSRIQNLTTEEKRTPYKGKTVLLIDEHAISQSEYLGMTLRAANGTVFIGSPTTGANGGVTGFLVPGGIEVRITGAEIKWPDGRPLQRVGLLPDIEAHPTVAGIRAGRDEILERAIAYIERGR